MPENNMTKEIDKKFPSDAPLKEQLRFLLNYAVLAPSGHNTQPWLFRLTDDSIELLADRTRALPVVDPHDRELIISCGAALDHLEVAARNFGQDLAIELLPDASNPDLLARIQVCGEVTPEEVDVEFFNAIPNRKTVRAQFEDKQIPEPLARLCKTIASEFGTELTLVKDQSMRSDIAELVSDGDRVQFSDPEFRKELSKWVHSRRRTSHDGVSGDTFGVPDSLSSVGALVIRTFDIGKGVAAGDKKKIVDGSPLLAIFSSPNDEPEAWIATGRALSRVLLKLTASGVSASYLNQPIEVKFLRPKLKQVVGCQGKPQLLLRFGYGEATPNSVRRSVDEVVV